MTQKKISGKIDLGVRINLHPEKQSDHVHVQRSDDGTTGTIEREWRVPGTQEQIVDVIPPTAGTKFYRTRGIGRTGCVSASSWTPWRQARATLTIPEPDIPKLPVGREVPWRGGSTRTMDNVGNWGGSQVIEATTEGYELYTYDSETNSTGGVKVGARKAGTTGVGANATDFQLQKAGELVTVPGSEFSADGNTKYHVFFRTTASGVDGTLTKSSAMAWAKIFLGSFTSASDVSTGGSSPPTASTGKELQ